MRLSNFSFNFHRAAPPHLGLLAGRRAHARSLGRRPTSHRLARNRPGRVRLLGPLDLFRLEKLLQRSLRRYGLAGRLRRPLNSRFPRHLGDLYAESGQTLQGSFSTVSKPNFASKYSLESSRRDLHNALLCTALESICEKWGKKGLAKTTLKRKKTRKREAIKQRAASHLELQ